MEEIDAVKILKEETKLTLSDLHDFAKWKLTAAAALAAIGLGLTKENSQAGGLAFGVHTLHMSVR